MKHEIKKILICSGVLSETKGGVAQVTRLLAASLRDARLEVTILTCCPDHIWELPGITVHHHPSPRTIWQAWRQADAAILQGCILKLAWPLLLLKQKVLLVRHIKKMDLYGIKRWLSTRIEKRSRVCAVSHFMKTLETAERVEVVPNPYNDSVFFRDPVVECTKDLIFVGRCVPGKGLNILLEAMKQCHNQYHQEHFLTLVGDLNETPEIKELLKKDDFFRTHVSCAGYLPAAEIAVLLRQHKTAVIPSICEEAFGIVALEALACGCSVIYSETGGLPEAAGGCGTPFENCNAAQLAQILAAPLVPADPDKVAAHLKRHTPQAVAEFYLKLLNNCR